VNAPNVNDDIGDFMFSSEYRRRAPLMKGYVVPQEVVMDGSPGCWPPHVARAWRLRPEQARRLNIDAPDTVANDQGHQIQGPNYYLIEVWENCGDDGHTEHELVGYVVITESDFNEMVDENLRLVRYIWRD
jgi:hypothetical protein